MKSQKEMSETSPTAEKVQLPISNETILTHIPLEEATDQSEEQGREKGEKRETACRSLPVRAN